MYQVYGFYPSRSLRVSWTLEEIDAPYEVISMLPRSPEARALNPSGKIPALRDGSLTLVDSAAICLYLADKHPEAQLGFPAGTPERARHDSYLQFAINDLEAPLWTLTKHTRLLPESERLPAILPSCASEFNAAVAALDARIAADGFADDAFLFGETFKVADVFMGHIGIWAQRAKLSVESPRVAAYFARAAARPALRRAVEKEKAASR